MTVDPYYEEKGQGEYFIFLHGNGEEHSYFVNQIEFFSSYYHVIAIDTRGHGKSPRGNKPFTIRQFVEDLHDFMLKHDIYKAHLLGFSDGGNIALLFAISFPDMVDHLILNGANLNGWGVKLSVQLPIVVEYYLTRNKKKKEMLGLMVKDPNIPLEDLSKVVCPTLVIAGNKDMIKDSHTKKIGQHIPHASTVIIDGNHFIAMNNPDAFNKEVMDFLNNN